MNPCVNLFKNLSNFGRSVAENWLSALIITVGGSQWTTHRPGFGTEGVGDTRGSGIVPDALALSKGTQKMRVILTLACGECKRRNYVTTKNKKTTPDRLELSKYCRYCRTVHPHKETK